MKASSQWKTRLGLGIEFLALISFIVVGAEVVLFHVPAPKFLKELCLYPGKPQKKFWIGLVAVGQYLSKPCD